MTKEELLLALSNKGIPCDETQINLLESYMEYILECNEHVNLTAIKNKEDFREKMIYDCALPVLVTDFNNKKVLDIGSGSGFPGFVLSVLTNADITMLDATKKKTDIISSFPLKENKTVNARAEDYCAKNRESFDIVIARAVAPLNILAELCSPFVKVGGTFIAMKGRDAENEIITCGNAFKKLNLEIISKNEEVLPCGEARMNIVFKKTKSCHKMYPRAYKDIVGKPLR